MEEWPASPRNKSPLPTKNLPLSPRTAFHATSQVYYHLQLYFQMTKKSTGPVAQWIMRLTMDQKIPEDQKKSSYD